MKNTNKITYYYLNGKVDYVSTFFENHPKIMFILFIFIMLLGLCADSLF